MGLRVPILAQYFSKSQNTIHSWISTFESGGSMERKEVVAVRKKIGERKKNMARESLQAFTDAIS